MSSTGLHTTVVTGASGFVAGEVIKQLLEKVMMLLYRPQVYELQAELQAEL